MKTGKELLGHVVDCCGHDEDGTTCYCEHDLERVAERARKEVTVQTVHLRKALRKIVYFASEHTGLEPVDIVAQINNLAHQGLSMKPLVGDPAIGKVP